jgi:hypothetical protein
MVTEMPMIDEDEHELSEYKFKNKEEKEDSKTYKEEDVAYVDKTRIQFKVIIEWFGVEKKKFLQVDHNLKRY